MPAMPLAHVSWAIADNADRPACDAFFLGVFGATTAYEMLVTPEAEAMGLDREERLMMIGDTMIIPIAPAGRGAAQGAPIGDMLRRSSGPDRWLGVALKVADLKAADAWFAARGFKLHYDPGMEAHYFLVGRRQALGMRLEILVQDLPGDPRRDPEWTPAGWANPLGIEGLQAIGVSAPSAEVAREVFAAGLDWPELGTRAMPERDAQCVAFNMGDTVIEVLVPASDASPVARHLAQAGGICELTFKVRDAGATAAALRAQGLDLIGDIAGRFAIRLDQAFGRTIWFSEATPSGYPPVGSRMNQPAVF